MTRPQSLTSRSRRPGRKARPPSAPGCHPRLEWLEGRLAPATFVVNSAQDLAPPPGTVTLRSALLAANADHGPDTITFAPSLAGQTITLALVGDVTAGPSALALGDAAGDPSTVTIDGGAAPGLVLSGPGGATNLRLFVVFPNSSLTLENLTLSNGQARGGAGAGGAAGQRGASHGGRLHWAKGGRAATHL